MGDPAAEAPSASSAVAQQALYAFCVSKNVRLPRDMSIETTEFTREEAWTRVRENMEWMDYYKSYPYYRKIPGARYYLPWHLDYLANRCCRVTFIRCKQGPKRTKFAQCIIYEGHRSAEKFLSSFGVAQAIAAAEAEMEGKAPDEDEADEGETDEDEADEADEAGEAEDDRTLPAGGDGGPNSGSV